MFRPPSFEETVLPLLKKYLLKAAVAGYFGTAALVILAAAHVHYYYKRAPEQPLAFSHKIHAGGLALECDHCHRYAGKSPKATVPALSVCMECHETAAAGKPEVEKLKRYWNEEKPIEWYRVYKLPWHVRFIHERHIRADIKCKTCHGHVEVMEAADKVRTLKMGWCVACHRASGASDDCLICHK